MKTNLLFSIVFFSAFSLKAQNVTSLSPGNYETRIKQGTNKWDKGDVILIDDTHYKLSGSNDIGEYRFSVAAQRLFFTSGPLKGAFTRVTMSNNKPAIVFPPDHNKDLGLTAEIWASKQ
jgi:hypothetical protein